MAGSSNLARQGHTVRSLRQRGAQRPGHRRAARVRPGRSRRAGAAGRLSEEALPSAGRGVSANDLTTEFHFLRLAVGLTDPGGPYLRELCGGLRGVAHAEGFLSTRRVARGELQTRGYGSQLWHQAGWAGEPASACGPRWPRGPRDGASGPECATDPAA